MDDAHLAVPPEFVALAANLNPGQIRQRGNFIAWWLDFANRVRITVRTRQGYADPIAALRDEAFRCLESLGRQASPDCPYEPLTCV